MSTVSLRHADALNTCSSCIERCRLCHRAELREDFRVAVGQIACHVLVRDEALDVLRRQDELEHVVAERRLPCAEGRVQRLEFRSMRAICSGVTPASFFGLSGFARWSCGVAARIARA